MKNTGGSKSSIAPLRAMVGCFVAIGIFSGCATIINDRTQRVNVNTSTGEKVDLTIDGMPFQAPGIASIQRRKSDRLITTADPRCAQSTILPSSVDSVFFINLISGGPLGSSTDYISEKMWRYEDNVVISCKR